MSSQVLIPRTIAEVEKSLGALGRLISAQEWERAAIVATFAEEGRPGRPAAGENGGNPPFISYRAFAAKGIVGLTNHETVKHYVTCWLSQRDRPTPGEVVDLTGLPTFPPNLTVGAGPGDKGGMTPERRDGLMAAGVEAGMKAGSKVVDIAANPKSMALAIINDDATAEAARLALQARDLGKRTGVDMGAALTAKPSEGPWSPVYTQVQHSCVNSIGRLGAHADAHPDELPQVLSALDAIIEYATSMRDQIAGVPDDISSLA